MNEFVISGSIYNCCFDAMTGLIRDILGEIRTKDNLFGEEISYQNENFRIFLENSHGIGRDWSLNADFKGSLDDLNDLLSRFTQKLIDSGFNYDIGYYQIDAGGNEIGEEVSLRHPDFDLLYTPPSGDR